MPAPYKQTFKAGGLVVTSLVLDKPEFDALCKEFIGIFPEITEEMAQRLIDAKHVPLMARGTKTQKFFDRYEIPTERMSIIVRGAGCEVFERVMTS
jgi:hypothetical protein